MLESELLLEVASHLVAGSTALGHVEGLGGGDSEGAVALPLGRRRRLPGPPGPPGCRTGGSASQAAGTPERSRSPERRASPQRAWPPQAWPAARRRERRAGRRGHRARRRGGGWALFAGRGEAADAARDICQARSKPTTPALLLEVASHLVTGGTALGHVEGLEAGTHSRAVAPRWCRCRLPGPPGVPGCRTGARCVSGCGAASAAPRSMRGGSAVAGDGGTGSSGVASGDAAGAAGRKGAASALAAGAAGLAAAGWDAGALMVAGAAGFSSAGLAAAGAGFGEATRGDPAWRPRHADGTSLASDPTSAPRGARRGRHAACRLRSAPSRRAWRSIRLRRPRASRDRLPRRWRGRAAAATDCSTRSTCSWACARELARVLAASARALDRMESASLRALASMRSDSVLALVSVWWALELAVVTVFSASALALDTAALCFFAGAGESALGLRTRARQACWRPRCGRWSACSRTRPWRSRGSGERSRLRS